MDQPPYYRDPYGMKTSDPDAESFVSSTTHSQMKSPDYYRSTSYEPLLYSPPGYSSPFVHRTRLWHLATLLPISTILVFSLAFTLYQYLYGAVAAPRLISDWVLDNPRQSTQIATIVASALTASIRWSLGTGAVHLAQKRFLHQFHPIFEMEAFAALKNISVVWDYKRHKKVLLLSWLVVATCGLLTSGFVALIAPFPIARTSPISGLDELNLAGADESCSSWYKEAFNKLWQPNPASPGALTCHEFGIPGLALSSCLATHHFPQALSAVSATILGYFASTLPSRKSTNFVSPYPTLNNTRILGGTAGTLPIGPAGVQVPGYPNLSSSGGNFNYTLKLQGLWLEGSCAYEQNSGLKVMQVAGSGTAEPSFLVVCPGSDAGVQYPIDSEDTNGMVIAHQCISQDMISVYWRSFSLTGKSTSDSVDFVRCDLAPRVGDIDAILYTDISAFKMIKPSQGSSPSTLLGRAFVELALRETDKALQMANTPAGNLLTHVVKELAQTYGGLSPDDWRQPNKIVPPLLGYLLQGVFELQVSEIRLLFTVLGKSVVRAPAPCFRPVEGKIIERLAGWNIQRTTVLGLAPLLLISAITITIIVKAMRIPGELPKFDPTSPVSVVGATSQGDVKFRHAPTAIVGSPDDEYVGNTEVSYTNHGNEIWGLKIKTQ